MTGVIVSIGLAALIVFIIAAPWLVIWLIASGIDARHEASLAEREPELAVIPVMSLRRAPADGASYRTLGLCAGNVVIGINAIRLVMTALRMFVGGECRSASAVFRQGRREALVRLRREARKMGATHVINVRFETASVMSSSQGGGKNSGGALEFLAYGTAVRRG